MCVVSEIDSSLFFSYSRVPELTEQDARQALLNYVASRYCYGKRAAKELTVTKIDNGCAFHVSNTNIASSQPDFVSVLYGLEDDLRQTIAQIACSPFSLPSQLRAQTRTLRSVHLFTQSVTPLFLKCAKHKNAFSAVDERHDRDAQSGLLLIPHSMFLLLPVPHSTFWKRSLRSARPVGRSSRT